MIITDVKPKENIIQLLLHDILFDVELSVELVIFVKG